MADNTPIEWTDATWNPITGCSVVSAGCKHCYAMKLAGTRLQHHPSRTGLTIETAAGPVWNGQVRLNEEWLDQPLRWRRPRMIFVCAHGDLFHESVPDAWIDKVFAVMALAPQHTFQVLTKRAARMQSYLSDPDVWPRIEVAARRIYRDRTGQQIAGKVLIGPLPHIWLGVSVENQDAANDRVPLLLRTPAAVRWISAEPLLGRVDLCEHLGIWWNQTMRCWESTGSRINVAPDGRPGIGWVVAGGESGVGARPMHPEWARSLRRQCEGAGVPFLFKQWGEWAAAADLPKDILLPANRWGWISINGGAIDISHHRPFVDECAHHELMGFVGKKAAGRLLDSALHDAYPEARHG